ncbi:hypothetical protein [Caballeronia sp. dw_19]|uniref:hypothetical protein n=1 Tax=Caballeronia sp. dw_19 TaxID=2719791 RepID=UPI001BCFC3BC|nr:hypothetical protein [Caballeronia sp. dw_19]
MEKKPEPTFDKRLRALEAKFEEREKTLRSSFEALLARHDVLALTLKTVIAASPEAGHLAELTYQRLTHFQNEALFSADSTEEYRASFEVIAQEFDPARVLHGGVK